MTDLPVEPVKKTPKTYTDAQKKAIMLSVSTLGVRGAARAANITVSTLSMWRTIARGTGRNDLAFMQAGRGDWVSKVGADGVQVIGSKSRGEALAIKIIDGNKPALFAATVEVLDQLGWLDDAQRKQLEPWRARLLRNARGLKVGERLPVFRMQIP